VVDDAGWHLDLASTHAPQLYPQLIDAALVPLCNLALACCAGAPDVAERYAQLMRRRELARLNVGDLEQAYAGLQALSSDALR
jgi:hypothetical protein